MRNMNKLPAVALALALSAGCSSQDSLNGDVLLATTTTTTEVPGCETIMVGADYAEVLLNGVFESGNGGCVELSYDTTAGAKDSQGNDCSLEVRNTVPGEEVEGGFSISFERGCDITVFNTVPNAEQAVDVLPEQGGNDYNDGGTGVREVNNGSPANESQGYVEPPGGSAEN